jgi:outer membrane protein OmpA-like peptidoglycan-associated protein
MASPGNFSTHKHPSTSEDHWIPLSDLMTGLMMIFMLVAVAFLVQAEAEKNLAQQKQRVMHDVAANYYDVRSDLYNDLYREFASDLPRWKATLTPDLVIRFEEPEVLFDIGQAQLKPQFMSILSDFFPRYIRIIAATKYRDSIDEVRIEGHTSTVWSSQVSSDEAYFHNMELSQSRTRSALEYVLMLPQVASEKRWLIAHFTANGLSSSHPRLNPDGTENREASQRVEFRVRTNAEARLGEILKAAQ